MSEKGILFFRLGDRRHAVEADAVRRISSQAAAGWVHSTVLGAPRKARRGLVAALDEEERALAVDEVLGIERLAPACVSPLPALARGALRTRGVAGLVTHEDELLLLVDLPHLIFESEESSPHAEDQ